jgi:predicted nucleic acid-binding protein
MGSVPIFIEDLARDAIKYTKKGLTGYDACYAALAMQLRGVWLTFDEKVHKRLSGERISHLLNKGLPKNW